MYTSEVILHSSPDSHPKSQNSNRKSRWQRSFPELGKSECTYHRAIKGPWISPSEFCPRESREKGTMAVNGRSSPLDSQYWACYLLCAHLCRLINPTIRSDTFVNFGRRNSKPVQRRSNARPATFPAYIPDPADHLKSPLFYCLGFTSYYRKRHSRALSVPFSS
jgi:hypothetical protein